MKKLHADTNGNEAASKRIRLNGNQKLKEVRADKKLKKRKELTNGIQLKCNTSQKIAFKSALPHDILQNGEPANEKPNGTNTIIGLSTPNASPIKQKVKYIPPNQFLHIKPPPINTQKIYVKPQNGNRSYTLKCENISQFPVDVQNNSTDLNHQNHINHIVTENNTTGEQIFTEDDTENSESLNIFDIPILFADNDGNIIDTNETSNEITETNVPQPANSIEIISDEIIKAAVGKLKQKNLSRSLFLI